MGHYNDKQMSFYMSSFLIALRVVPTEKESRAVITHILNIQYMFYIIYAY